MQTVRTNTPGPWDLEEIPYETNDPAGGWYLHFDPTGETTDAALYMSRAHVTEEQARLIVAAPTMLGLLRRFARGDRTFRADALRRRAKALRLWV